jgi:hypothetical protein
MAEEDYREVIRRIADSLERIERDQKEIKIETANIKYSLQDLTPKKSGLDLLPDSWAKSLLLYLRAKNFLWHVPFFVLTMIILAAFAWVGYLIIFWSIFKLFS